MFTPNPALKRRLLSNVPADNPALDPSKTDCGAPSANPRSSSTRCWFAGKQSPTDSVAAEMDARAKTAVLHPLVGQTLNQYRIEGVLGQGGMGWFIEHTTSSCSGPWR